MSSRTQEAVDPVLLELFRAELETHTRVLEEGLIKTEEDQSAEKLQALMRAAHSIKGAARMLGLDRAVRLAHAMEDVLVAAQRGKDPLTAAKIDVLLRSNDVFLRAAALTPGAIPAALEDQGKVTDSLISELSAPSANPATDPAKPLPGAAVVEIDPALMELFHTELENHAKTLQAGLGQAENLQSAEDLEPLMRAMHSIKGAARILGLDRAMRLADAMEHVVVAAQRASEPLPPADVDALARGNGVFLRAAAVAPTVIAEQFERESGIIEHLIADLTETRPFPAPLQAKPAPTSGPATTEHHEVRVAPESLNRLVGLAGECLAQTRLTRPLSAGLQRVKQRQAAAARGLERTLDLLRQGEPAAAQSELEHSLEQFRRAGDVTSKYSADFGDWSRRLEALIDPLYTEAVASRMRPFSDGTHGYGRMVHDLARDLGKKVHFRIEGASTPVDRDILDRLESPLTHLLRNALDHGIEPPSERTSCGKPAEGTLILMAHQVSGMLRIAVSDDGAGIDLPELRRKVVAAGYVSESIARDLGDAEILEFLFLPGFSTAGAVTELSGRGVGMDVVQSAVRAVGGSVRVQTTPGTGTTVELQLPLTLSIVRALLAEIGGEAYAIPLTRIDRLLLKAPEDMEVVEDHQFCTLDGQHVGVIGGRQVLGIHGENGSGAACIIVISDRLSRYGLAVDRFLGERDLVVKPLPACLGKVANISAGAILDDATPVLILDTDDLVRSMDRLVTQGSLRKVASVAKAEHPPARRRVLVVDDSLTVREVERRLLENRGYDVVAAIDGVDGWNALQRASFDLLVTDVDMPRMDGLELIRRVRAAPRTVALPVVIVSYKEQPEYRIKGMEAGANYYLTKSSFHDESLADAVRDLIGEA